MNQNDEHKELFAPAGFIPVERCFEIPREPKHRSGGASPPVAKRRIDEVAGIETVLQRGKPAGGEGVVELAFHAILVFALLFTGCSGEQYGDVTGKVTLDGEPLAGATVEFQPDGGSPAYGVTDEQGNYKLLFSSDQQGAALGNHRVRIFSFNEGRPREKERVPVKYNRQSDLVREVKRGDQTFNFDLLTK